IRDLIQKRTPEDTSLEAILAFFGSVTRDTPASVKAKFKEYAIENGLLRYQGRIIVPDDSTIKREIAKHFHDSPLAGHPGQSHTLELIEREYYWPALKAWVNCYVEQC